MLFSSDFISFDENYLPSLVTNDFDFLDDLQSIQDVEGHESVLMAQDGTYYLQTTEQYISDPGKIKEGKTIKMDFSGTYGGAVFKNWEYEHMDGLLDAIEMGSNLILGGIDAANTSNVFIYTTEKQGNPYWSILAPVPHVTLDPGGMQMIVTPRFLNWDQLLQTYPNFALDLAFDKIEEDK